MQSEYLPRKVSAKRVELARVRRAACSRTRDRSDGTRSTPPPSPPPSRPRGRSPGSVVVTRYDRPRHLHDLGRPPPGVVGAAVADLAVQLVRRRVRLDEVVGRPLELVERVRRAGPSLHVGVAVLDDAPREHGGGRRHRQPELHVIAGVVPAAGEVAADVGRRPRGPSRRAS